MSLESNSGKNTEPSSLINSDSFKVVVSKDLPFDDNGPVGTTWLLHKLADQNWVPCRRDNPDDSTAFEHLKQVRWRAYPIGEYTLAGMKLSPEHIGDTK